jgi:hypothetical protein
MKEIAAGLASLGRGPDTMLVHMAPEEVAGLQKLALAHGGSLTTNPQTGLPEAGFLKNILPTVLGIGASVLSGGAITPMMAGLGIGGIQALRTGDIGQGLLAGLGGFGGATLGGMLGGLGGAAGSTAAQGATAAGSRAADIGLKMGAGGLGMTPIPGSAEMLGVAGAGPSTALSGAGMAGTGAGITAPAGASLGSGAAPSFLDKSLAWAKANPMQAGALGLGAVGAMGGFDQPQSGFAAPQEERSNVQLSGRWKPDYEETESGMHTPGHIYFPGDRYRGSFAEGGSTHSVPMLEDGGFVLTKKAVDGLGGQQAAKAGLGAIPIKGPGTGTSDSIPTSIDGVRPALVSNGEAYIPKREVKRQGGAKKFYALMRAAERNAARA